MIQCGLGDAGLRLNLQLNLRFNVSRFSRFLPSRGSSSILMRLGCRRGIRRAMRGLGRFSRLACFGCPVCLGRLRVLRLIGRRLMLFSVFTSDFRSCDLACGGVHRRFERAFFA